MKPLKAFLKNINILNLLLFAVAIFLAIQVNNSFGEKKIKFTAAKAKDIILKSHEKAAENPVTYMDYAVITEKNLFHPKRKVPSEAEGELVKPEIILYGTLITEDKKIAYIEDKKNPYSTPGRGKRQVVVNEGSTVAGYKLVEVKPESIVLVRGEDKIVVNLNTQKERIAETATAGKKPSTPGAPDGAVVAQPVPQTAPVVTPPRRSNMPFTPQLAPRPAIPPKPVSK